ncbi:MAG: hypothetical protein K2M70_08580 [Lachnospiraceae bacterium]|nr:hypothetical protein [Lachnospiraceae bacterium]
MQELYSIMRELLEVEYNQKSLHNIMRMLGKAYEQEEECEKSDLIVNGIGYYLASLHRDLGIAIGRLDSYIAESAKKE